MVEERKRLLSEEKTESSSVLPTESVEETDIAEEVEETDELQNEGILENPTQVINDLNEWVLTGITIPQRYCVNEFIYFTQRDDMADGSQVSKVLRYDRNTSKLEVVYQTGYKEKGEGRVVSRIGGTNEELFLAVIEYLDTEEVGWMEISNWYVIKLDPDTGMDGI